MLAGRTDFVAPVALDTAATVVVARAIFAVAADLAVLA
jgi:hypothetical protein